MVHCLHFADSFRRGPSKGAAAGTAPVCAQCTPAAEAGAAPRLAWCARTQVGHTGITSPVHCAPAPALRSGSSVSPLFKMQVSFQLLFYIQIMSKVDESYKVKHFKTEKYPNKDCPTILILSCTCALCTVSKYLLLICFGSTEGITKSVFRGV